MWKVRIAHIANKRICCVTKPLLNTILRVLWCIYYLLDLSNLKIFTLDEDAVILADDHKFCFCCLFWLVFITPWPLGGSITSLPAFLDWGARRHHWLPCEMRNERRISSWRRVIITPHLAGYYLRLVEANFLRGTTNQKTTQIRG